MSWLNVPKAIIESERDQVEEQYYGTIATVYRRARAVSWKTTRWVGGNYAAASAKKAEYAGNTNAEAHVEKVGESDQYHCIVTEKTLGDWSAWEISSLPEE